MRKIRIGTRKSRLACIQAQMVADYIETHCEGYEAELVTVMTTGDRILSKRLDEIGGKGLFVKELDTFLLEGYTDLSVHSLKDMPMEIAPNIPIIGYSAREDARDVLVLPEGTTEYEYGGPIGCSSNRRSLQLKKIYPNDPCPCGSGKKFRTMDFCRDFLMRRRRNVPLQNGHI